MIQIHFDTYQNVIQLDLNKITQGVVDLVPNKSSDLNYSLQLPSEKEKLLPGVGGSTLHTDEESSARASSKSPTRRGKSSEKTGKKGDPATKYTERAYYGIILKKMRKVLTLRQEYVMVNKTMFDYVLKIQH